MRSRFTFTGKANTITCIHTRGNLHRECFTLFPNPLATTAATGIGDHLAASMTCWTGLLYREKTLSHSHLTSTLTGSTGDR